MCRKYPEDFTDKTNEYRKKVIANLITRKEYTDDSVINEIKERDGKFHKFVESGGNLYKVKGEGDGIKHSEYLILWMNRLLTAHPYDLEGVMYRMKKRYGKDTTFEQAVEWLDRDIRQAEAEGN